MITNYPSTISRTLFWNPSLNLRNSRKCWTWSRLELFLKCSLCGPKIEARCSYKIVLITTNILGCSSLSGSLPPRAAGHTRPSSLHIAGLWWGDRGSDGGQLYTVIMVTVYLGLIVEASSTYWWCVLGLDSAVLIRVKSTGFLFENNSRRIGYFQLNCVFPHFSFSWRNAN